MTIDGATITGHAYVGAVAGYLEYGSIADCTVKNVKISALHKDGTRCGDKAGALIGLCAPNGAAVAVQNCKAEDCTVTAAREASQLIGYIYANNTISGNTATNVTVVAEKGDCSKQQAGQVNNDLYGWRNTDKNYVNANID